MKAMTAFDPNDLPFFEPTTKVGLLATVNPEGLPHLTMITALQAKTPTQLVWGQFTEGQSKTNVKTNPHVGFLMMTMDRKLWRGKALYTHAAKEGDDYVMFNNKPMFRYNSYFGINTVHYMDLKETYGREALPLASIAPALLLTKLAKGAAATKRRDAALNPWSRELFNRLDSFAFIAWVGPDGFPTIVPLLQCQCADAARLVFSPFAYEPELSALPAGAVVAVFGLSLKMEDVLTRGVFRGYARRRGVKLGEIDIDYVYNSMPPNQRQIYPPVEITPVREF